MSAKGNGAQYIPVYLTKEQWKAVSFSVATDKYIGPKTGSEVEGIIQDAIEWAEGR